MNQALSAISNEVWLSGVCSSDIYVSCVSCVSCVCARDTDPSTGNIENEPQKNIHEFVDTSTHIHGRAQ
jgi:hypothetical protein